MLLERVAKRARAAGIEQLMAICFATDRTVVRLLSGLGATTVGASEAAVAKLGIGLKSTRSDHCASEPASGGWRD
jgi:hypothetical protein